MTAGPPERQRRFIEALARTGSVKSAAHAVNMTPEGAYLLRRHAQAEEFRAAWEAALALGVQRLEDVAMERALYGVEVPVYHFGAVVGARRVYNDRLLMFLLRNRAPGRFAANSWQNADAATKAQLDRLKREWRKEWEQEREAEAATDSGAVLDSIDATLETMHQRWLAYMSPRTRRIVRSLPRGRGGGQGERLFAGLWGGGGLTGMNETPLPPRTRVFGGYCTWHRNFTWHRNLISVRRCRLVLSVRNLGLIKLSP